MFLAAYGMSTAISVIIQRKREMGEREDIYIFISSVSP